MAARHRRATMGDTRQLTIRLPAEMADAVDAKVASGEYACDSDVISDGVQALLDHDQALERWLVDVGVPAYDRLKSGQGRTYTIEEVLEHLQEDALATS
jgi:Arc/MetJ-type ribon-helix-helix transcriptional regulator